MNLELEMEEAPVEEAPIVTTVVTEEIPDLTAVTITEPTDFQPYLDILDRRIARVPKPHDEKTLLYCGLTIQFCKDAAKMAAARKLALETAHKPLLDAIDWWGEKKRLAEQRAKELAPGMNEFLYELEQAALRKQQEENAKAEQERIRLDKEREEAEKAARDAANAGNLEVAAAAVAKVEELIVQADMTVPDVVPVHTKKLDLGAGVTLSGKAPDKEWKLAGWDKAKPIRVLANGKVDPRIASLIGDISKLPPGVLFVLQHVDMNPVHLNASYKGGLAFPAPFTEGLKFGGSVLRGGK